jgi:hypothetical protein
MSTRSKKKEADKVEVDDAKVEDKKDKKASKKATKDKENGKENGKVKEKEKEKEKKEGSDKKSKSGTKEDAGKTGSERKKKKVVKDDSEDEKKGKKKKVNLLKNSGLRDEDENSDWDEEDLISDDEDEDEGGVEDDGTLRSQLIDVGKSLNLEEDPDVSSSKDKDSKDKKSLLRVNKHKYFDISEQDVIDPANGRKVNTIGTVIIKDQALETTLSSFNVCIEYPMQEGLGTVFRRFRKPPTCPLAGRGLCIYVFIYLFIYLFVCFFLLFVIIVYRLI